jgi:hypothetical protein
MLPPVYQNGAWTLTKEELERGDSERQEQGDTTIYASGISSVMVHRDPKFTSRKYENKYFRLDPWKCYSPSLHGVHTDVMILIDEQISKSIWAEYYSITVMPSSRTVTHPPLLAPPER